MKTIYSITITLLLFLGVVSTPSQADAGIQGTVYSLIAEIGRIADVV